MGEVPLTTVRQKYVTFPYYIDVRRKRGVIDLETLANLAEVLGALTIIGGVLYAVVQIRQHRQQLRETATLEFMRPFQTSEFARAFQVLRSLDDDVSSTELHAKKPEVEAAAMSVCSVYETIGVLVFSKILPFQVVEDLTGGAIVLCWRKLRTWIEETRLETSNERMFEWFQWLAERFLEQQLREAKSRPAYQAYRSWKIPRQ